MRRIFRIMLIAYNIVILFSCSSQKKEFQNNIEKMQSKKITIPYDQMACWTSDSILDISPWRNAKYKLVHYVDSASCSSCYLQKVKINDFLFNMEKKSNNNFYKKIIINPGSKAKKELKKMFFEKLIPQTIFIDSTNIFSIKNPNIPLETQYHTFLLDPNNNVVLVGNPITNKKIREIFLAIIEKKLGKIYKENQ